MTSPEFTLAALGCLGQNLVLFKNSLYASCIGDQLYISIARDLHVIFTEFCDEVQMPALFPSIKVVNTAIATQAEQDQASQADVCVRISSLTHELELDIRRFIRKCLATISQWG